MTESLSFLKEGAEKPEEYTKITPGVGTDVFIRKKAPGSQVGEGYIVDIYENGVKIDTLTKENKRETIELIREFKEKYNTDRAFQNELQVHITYKTKEERGELAMTSLDNQLMKKANTIQNILFRLLRPEMPVIHRTAEEGMGGVESIPTVPGAGIDKESIKQFMLDEIMKKYTQFVKDKVSQESPIDDIYNSLRKWYGKLSDNILMFNKQDESNQFTKADIEPIISETTRVLTSKDPQLITKTTGIEIDQGIADAMAEVGTKSVGKPGEAEKGGDLGGDPETAQTREEAAAGANSNRVVKGTIEDDIFDLEKQIQAFGTTRSIPQLAQELKLDTPEKIKEMHDMLSRSADLNEAQTAIKVWVEDEMRHEEKTSTVKEWPEKVSEFWKYASTVQGVHNIDDIFMEWLPASGIETAEKTAAVWDGICRDVESAFSRIIEVPDVIDKKADYAANGEGRLVITAYTNEGPQVVLDGYVEWVTTKNRLEFVSSVDRAGGISNSIFTQIMSSMYVSNQQEATEGTNKFFVSIKESPEYINSYLSEIFDISQEGSVDVSIEQKDSVGGSVIYSDAWTMEKRPGTGFA